MLFSSFTRTFSLFSACALLATACGGPEAGLGGDDELELLEDESAVIGTVDLAASGAVSGSVVTCASQNLGPGSVTASDSWATGVELRHPRTGAILWYAWIQHNVDLAPGASTSFGFDASRAIWRSPQKSYLSFPPEAVGSLSGFRVDCTANAGLMLPNSSPSGMFLDPPAIPEGSTRNNRKTVQKK